MLPNLELLIRLQKLETSAAEAQARIDEVPTLRDALKQRIAECKTAVETAQAELAEHRTARAAVEKEVAEVQSRLSRFKNQLMAVKTNKEYHAVQSEVLEAEQADLTQKIAKADSERNELGREISPDIRDLFDLLARGRKGSAVAEARQGLCTSCRVHLRPQLFNQLRSNAKIIQCESCQRILYFVENSPAEAAPANPTAPSDA